MLTDMRETRLTNGIRVVSASLPHVESASIGVWVGAGSRDESNQMAGASHFVEHLLFKGTETRSAQQITQSIEGRGGDLNAFTQEESTCYYARVPYDHVADSLDVLADMFLNSKLDRREVERERGVVLEEILMYHDQPQHVVHEMLDSALWPSHPLGRPVAGSEKPLLAMSRESLSDFISRHYIPSRTVIAFAGRVEHERCVEQAHALFGGMQKGRKPARRKVSASLPQHDVSIDARDIEQVHVALGMRCTFGRSDQRRFALRVLNAILGENMSSRLFQVVREQHGLAYSVQSSIQMYAETSALVVSAGLDRKRARKAAELICRELVRLRDGRITKAELNRARDYLVGHTRLGLESTSSQMIWLGETTLSYGHPVDPCEPIAEVGTVGVEEVKAIASEVIRSGCTSLTAVTPLGDEFTEDLCRSFCTLLD